MRDCAGLDSSSSEDVVELDSAGPGDMAPSWSARDVVEGSGDLAADDDPMGRDERRFRAPACSVARLRFGGRGDDPLASLSTAVLVLADVLREMTGLPEPASGVAEALLPSLRGMGESRRMDRAEAVRWFSDPGTGDGADEPLAAAVAFLTCARTCDAWRSVR